MTEHFHVIYCLEGTTWHTIFLCVQPLIKTITCINCDCSFYTNETSRYSPSSRSVQRETEALQSSHQPTQQLQLSFFPKIHFNAHFLPSALSSGRVGPESTEFNREIQRWLFLTVVQQRDCSQIHDHKHYSQLKQRAKIPLVAISI